MRIASSSVVLARPQKSAGFDTGKRRHGESCSEVELAQSVKEINRRIFLWPGDAHGPTGGSSAFGREANELPPVRSSALIAEDESRCASARGGRSDQTGPRP